MKNSRHVTPIEASSSIGDVLKRMSSKLSISSQDKQEKSLTSFEEILKEIQTNKKRVDNK